MIVAITGCIGSGKSSVCKELAKLLSCKVLSADLICRDLLSVGGLGWVQLQKLYGSEFFLADGQLNRPEMRRQLFANDTLRQQLDGILHPMVREEMLEAALMAKKQQYPIVAEVPLLFEKGWQADFDHTVLVFADTVTCVQRIVSRDQVTEEEAMQALATQMPMLEKKQLADTIINNNEQFTATRQQLIQLKTEFLKNIKKNS